MELRNNILVSDLLKRENNNLDIFRMLAAVMVIIGHSYVLTPTPGKYDLIGHFFPFTYSGALAVKIFFFISGLVVTNSLMYNKSVVHFIISRLFRIFPALIFVCIVTAFLIGPLITTLSVHDYFNTRLTYLYVKDNILLNTNFFLPETFQNNAYPKQANASLWTLPFEVGCYFFLLALYSIGVFGRKIIVNTILLIIIFEFISPVRFVTDFLAFNGEIVALPACFMIGVILAYNKESIKINFLQTFGFFLLAYAFRYTRFVDMLFYAFVFSLILNLCYQPFVLKLKLKNDISYGIYLWGFLIQQLIECYLKYQHFYVKVFLAIAISIVLGYVSWMLIEKRSINIGKWLISKIELRFIKRT